MRIGVDIDGVLTNMERYQLDHYTKKYYELGITLKDPFAYHTHEIFKSDKKFDYNMWREDSKYFFLPPRDFASEIINKLKDDGHEIYIVTARGSRHDEERNNYIRNTTFNWFKEHNINVDKVIFTSGSKLEVCKENNVDIMIEDMKENIEEISTKIPCLVFDAIYNRDCKNENIIRVYSWYHIYSVIKELQNK